MKILDLCKKGGSLALGLLLPLFSNAQFPPAAGQPGSTAVSANSPAILSWANQVAQQNIGPVHIQQPSLGLASTGSASSVLGPANDGQVLSLGDGGSVTLYFPNGIPNRAGFDFAVFENGFSDTFLELAFVEVSSDGQDFVRFSAQSLSDTNQQIGPFGAIYPENIHNLAGKYRAGYGTPFDLAELQDSSQLDLTQVRYLRLVDVVGSLDEDYARRDAFGRKINDPFPTPFPSGGFDLDAVAILDMPASTVEAESEANYWYPNRLAAGQSLQSSTDSQGTWRIWSFNGQLLRTGSGPEVPTDSAWPAGCYILEYQQHRQRFWLY